ncbi:hypothetical protein L0128_17065 [candidate division KSB1 bacterium]|nr:hypothetical protein [candidate division KSB1 bacterium]
MLANPPHSPNKIFRLLLIGLLFTCQQYPRAVTLALQYHPQEAFAYRIDIRNEITVGFAAEKKMKFTEESRHRAITRVLATDSDSASIEIQYQMLARKTTKPWEKPPVKTDTSSQSTKVVQMRLQKSGKILSVSGDSSHSASYYDSFYQQAQPVFPERPLKVGDSWSQETKLMHFHDASQQVTSPQTTSTTYTVVGFTTLDQHPCVVIDYAGEIFLAENFSKPQMYGKSESRKAYSKVIRVNGKLFFGYKIGKIIKEEITLVSKIQNIMINARGKESSYHVEVNEWQSSHLE